MPQMKISALFIAGAILSGCANQPIQTPVSSEESEILASMSNAVQRATDAQVRLAAMKGANRSLLAGDSQSGEGLDMPISIAWNGPINRLAEKIAELSGLQYGGELGTRPPGGVMVSVSVTNEKARLILLNANAKAGVSARIELVDSGKKIVVHYPQTVQSGGLAAKR
jgi:protein-disulfide isomerase